MNELVLILNKLYTPLLSSLIIDISALHYFSYYLIPSVTLQLGIIRIGPTGKNVFLFDANYL